MRSYKHNVLLSATASVVQKWPSKWRVTGQGLFRLRFKRPQWLSSPEHPSLEVDTISECYFRPGPFRATTSPHHMPLSTPTGRVACGLVGFDNRKPGLRLSRIAAGSTIKGHSCTLDQAIALGSIWAIDIAIVLPHIASNHPYDDP
jgi:hypothetical protein